ncbi:hypothetical protein BZG36_00908 [Bifiguratus adelaidae]|uniref:Uncharacterized protein n=1 Tax=Bifiguratus adelaidae TaxID=1938954 RepID=A0A261Y5F1_9FUNG|nr:hypothetical protein BZG36_00908 [Bifiguratus adelaidae]
MGSYVKHAQTTIPSHFGDIMSQRETSLRLPDDFGGLERMLLTANGNLQRLLSAYFNAPISVNVLYNKVMSEPNTYGPDQTCILRGYLREVNLCINGIKGQPSRTVCNAKSAVYITDPAVLRLVEEEGVGIGQIFRYLDRLPNFELFSIGRSAPKEGKKDYTFWRLYKLSCPGVDCFINERFAPGFLEPGWIEQADADIALDHTHDKVWQFADAMGHDFLSFCTRL